MAQEIKEENKNEKLTIFHVGKFSFTQDDNAVLVHNNSGKIPVYIRHNVLKNEDEAYLSARKQAIMQSRS